MLIIESIKISRVSDDTKVVAVEPDLAETAVDINEHLQTVEIVRPALFNCKGREYWVGWSESVEAALGIPMTVINDQQIELNRVKTERWAAELTAENLLIELDRIRKAKWWTRLLWVFVGTKKKVEES